MANPWLTHVFTTRAQRAYYDRTGYEDNAAASAASASAAAQRARHYRHAGGGFDEFDAADIFNAFFGG